MVSLTEKLVVASGEGFEVTGDAVLLDLWLSGVSRVEVGSSAAAALAGVDWSAGGVGLGIVDDKTESVFCGS